MICIRVQRANIQERERERDLLGSIFKFDIDIMHVHTREYIYHIHMHLHAHDKTPDTYMVHGHRPMPIRSAIMTTFIS